MNKGQGNASLTKNSYQTTPKCSFYKSRMKKTKNRNQCAVFFSFVETPCAKSKCWKSRNNWKVVYSRAGNYASSTPYSPPGNKKFPLKFVKMQIFHEKWNAEGKGQMDVGDLQTVHPK